MGLAEPRKRLKIAHDPRNLQWLSTDSSASFGKRLMQQQGWQQGQSLGARPPSNSHNNSEPTEFDNARLAAAKVGVVIKDDTMGLGAQLKSRDVQHQKTGLDAFQGLLGRLNSKTEEELRAVERKEEDKKLEVHARGKWGGMVFVRGGVLVQGEEFKKKADAERRAEEESVAVGQVGEAPQGAEVEEPDDGRKRRKEEKRRLKEEQRARKEEKRARKLGRAAVTDVVSMQESRSKASPPRPVSVPAPDEPKSSEDETGAIQPPTEQPRKRRRSSINAEEAIKRQVLTLKNGRHLLRGRNIEAKRRAFSDTKGLDAIFMKTG